MGRATAAVPGPDAIPPAQAVPGRPEVEPAAPPLQAEIDVPVRRGIGKVAAAVRRPVTKRAAGRSVGRRATVRSAPVRPGVSVLSATVRSAPVRPAVTGRTVVHGLTAPPGTGRSGRTAVRRVTVPSA